MSGTTYPVGIIKLDGSSKAFHRLHPYQQQRLERLAKRGVKEAGIDDYGNAHVVTPDGHTFMIRRPAGRKWAQAYYGICLGLWINAIETLHPTMLGYVGLAAAQIVVHEAWPKALSRRRRTAGDRLAESIKGVL